MGSNGDDARQIMNLERRYEFRGPKWSPDGQRIVYLKNTFGTTEGSIEARSISDGGTSVLIAGMGLLDFWWTADGRLIYSKAAASEEATYDLWEQRIDSKSLRPIGEPNRLTRWVGHSPGFVSISANGKRIVTTKGYTQSDVYVVELDANRTKLKPERQLTVDTRSDWPSGWTADGNEVLYFSDRNGPFNIFKQSQSTDQATTVVHGKENTRGPKLSPDGQWLLYTLWPDRNQKAPVRVMRNSAAGGSAETVLQAAGSFASGITFSPGGEQDPQAKGAKSFPDFRCPMQSPSASCLLAEAEQDSVVFTSFDPVRGRGIEATRVQTSPSKFFWDLSPDGLRIAYGEFRSTAAEYLTIFALKDRITREIALGARTNLSSVAWSAGGQDLFVTTLKREGSELLHVGLDGKVDVLSETMGLWFFNPRPSPNDRFLAFALRTVDSNVWLIEAK